MGAWSSFLANLDEHQARALSSPGNIKMRLGNVWEMDLPGKWLVNDWYYRCWTILLHPYWERKGKTSSSQPIVRGLHTRFVWWFPTGYCWESWLMNHLPWTWTDDDSWPIHVQQLSTVAVWRWLKSLCIYIIYIYIYIIIYIFSYLFLALEP